MNTMSVMAGFGINLSAPDKTDKDHLDTALQNLADRTRSHVPQPKLFKPLENAFSISR